MNVRIRIESYEVEKAAAAPPPNRPDIATCDRVKVMLRAYVPGAQPQFFGCTFPADIDLEAQLAEVVNACQEVARAAMGFERKPPSVPESR